jgi:hypothetical protein
MQLQTQVLYTTPTWTVLTQPLSYYAAGASGFAKGLPANMSLQHQVVNPFLEPTPSIDPLSCCAVLCCAAGAAGVARGLPANSSLQHLDLAATQLDDKGGEGIKNL